MLAGIGAAACMLAKYWSAFLLAGVIVAALVDSRRLAYFRSYAPWITAVVGFAVLGPHLVWLFHYEFVPFEYAMAKHVASSFGGVVVTTLVYLGGLAAYAAAPLLAWAVAATGPNLADNRRQCVACG